VGGSLIGGHVVAECLRRHGVRHIFGVPGESVVPVLDGLQDAGGLTAVVTRHEEGAAVMAEAYAKATGSVGVCFGARGVGAAHLSIGLHTALQDSTPLVALVGEVPTGFEHREAFQEMDVPAFLRPTTKWAGRVDRPERLPELLARAFHLARSGRPGPVALALPEDVLYARTEAEPCGPTGEPWRPAPDPEAVRRAAGLLLAAQRPAILAGGGVLRAGAQAELARLAEALAAPVHTAWRRYDAFPNDHPLYLGPLGLGVRPDFVPALRDADAVLAAGTRLGECSTCGYRLPRPGTKLVHLDVAPEVIGAWYPAAVGVVADARLGLAALADEVERRAALGEGASSRAARAAANERLRAEYVRWATPGDADGFDGAPVDPEGVVAALARELPPEAAIVTDAGNFSGWFQRYWRYRRPKTYFGPTSGAMGYAVPGCLGVALALPDRPVVGLVGDGGLLMTAGELETAVRSGAAFTLLVFNNFMYGAIRMHQNLHFPGRPGGTDLGNPDFAALARSFGCHAERVERDADVGPALRRALGSGRVAVVELVTRRERLSAYAG
jgi:acetolactate synthase-1/2/3 large subunit